VSPTAGQKRVGPEADEPVAVAGEEDAWRRDVVHAHAPELHASANATMWSMSTSAGSVQVAPSNELYHEPRIG
jgi:hypothetical protein